MRAQSQSLMFEIFEGTETFFETPVIIGEATGEATSSSELSPDRTASEYNLSEDIFSEIESEISIK